MNFRYGMPEIKFKIHENGKWKNITHPIYNMNSKCSEHFIDRMDAIFEYTSNSNTKGKLILNGSVIEHVDGVIKSKFFIKMGGNNIYFKTYANCVSYVSFFLQQRDIQFLYSNNIDSIQLCIENVNNIEIVLYTIHIPSNHVNITFEYDGIRYCNNDQGFPFKSSTV